MNARSLEDVGATALAHARRVAFMTGAEMTTAETPPAGAATATTTAPPTAAQTVAGTVLNLLRAASVAACVVHGYRRNDGSYGWALGWGLLGGIFPVIAPAFAYAQGFGKPAHLAK